MDAIPFLTTVLITLLLYKESSTATYLKLKESNLRLEKSFKELCESWPLLEDPPEKIKLLDQTSSPCILPPLFEERNFDHSKPSKALTILKSVKPNCTAELPCRH